MTDMQIQMAQYKNLRKAFDLLVSAILGGGYYNNSLDVYNCDLECCQDIVNEYNRKIFKQVENPFTDDVCRQIIEESFLAVFADEKLAQ
jgi:hypothetical protein